VVCRYYDVSIVPTMNLLRELKGLPKSLVYIKPL
jgi:hypothetical protein